MKKTCSERSRRILFITNGHGEDQVAAEIIKKIAGAADVSVLPLVGEGQRFDPLEVEIIGGRKKLPSGGFSLRHLASLPQDIYAGLIGNTLEQIKILQSKQGQFDLVVAIGDIVPIIGALFTKAPFIFVGVNKSNYYKRFGYKYTPWEKFLLQKYALKVFVRDKITEQNLRRHGLKIAAAEYVGNPLMDCFEQLPRKAPPDSDTKVIGFLPGTRDDARLNLEDFEKIMVEIIKLKNSDFGLKALVATNLNNIPQHLEKRSFAEVLAESHLIIGLSGTGNEQAAGSGVPLVSFYGRGPQYTKRFAEAQKELLGEALSLVRVQQDSIAVAAEVWELLRHPEKLKKMGQIGRERMGRSGAIEKIADFILNLKLGPGINHD